MCIFHVVNQNYMFRYFNIMVFFRQSQGKNLRSMSKCLYDKKIDLFYFDGNLINNPKSPRIHNFVQIVGYEKV